MQKHRIYVAGPLTNPSVFGEFQNVKRASEVGVALMGKGHDVFVPHAATWPLELLGAHHPHQRWLDMDFGIMKAWATALYLIGSSPGADAELELAESLGLPVFHSLDEVPDARVPQPVG